MVEDEKIDEKLKPFADAIAKSILSNKEVIQKLNEYMDEQIVSMILHTFISSYYRTVLKYSDKEINNMILTTAGNIATYINEKYKDTSDPAIIFLAISLLKDDLVKSSIDPKFVEAAKYIKKKINL